MATRSALRSLVLCDSQKRPFSDNGTGTIYTVEKAYSLAPEFMEHYRNNVTSGDALAEDPRLLEVITRTTELIVANLKRSNDAECENGSKIDVDGLRAPPSQDVKYNVYKTDAEGSVLVARFTNEELSIADEDCKKLLDATSLNVYDGGCDSCPCSDSPIFFSPRMREDTLPAILATVSAVGTFCCLVFVGYLACKTCQEVVEGSQAFSILLLVTLIFLYAGVAPFTQQEDDLVCYARIHWPALAYAAAFGVLLARSVMLATTDNDGLPGHVSGVQQSVLWLALVSVQAALSVQEWFLRGHAFAEMSEESGELRCADAGSGLVFRLSYPVVLLLAQLLLSPFVVSSRRNYREGAVFFLAAISNAGVFLAWTLAFFLAMAEWDEEWFDVMVCAGLIATPTLLLIVVFVPKVCP